MSALFNWFDQVAEKNGFFLGRFFIGLLFLVTGIMSLINFEQTKGLIMSAGLPLAGTLTVIVLAMKIGGGAALVAGRNVRYGAMALIAFTLLATGFFHLSLDPMQLGSTLKNVAIIGGLILVYRGARN